MKKTFLFGLLLITFCSLTGCQNTVAGFGSDMQQNGKKIETSAKSDSN